MFGVAKVHLGIGEVQFQAIPQLGMLGASIDFREGVLSERIDTAESAKTVRVSCDLLSRPIVLRLDLCILVTPPDIGAAMRICHGQDQGAPNTGGIELSNETF